MEGLGASSSHGKQLWTVSPLQSGGLSWVESATPAGLQAQGCAHLELEGPRSMGVGAPQGKETTWGSRGPRAGSTHTPSGHEAPRHPELELEGLRSMGVGAPQGKGTLWKPKGLRAGSPPGGQSWRRPRPRWKALRQLEAGCPTQGWLAKATPVEQQGPGNSSQGALQ